MARLEENYAEKLRSLTARLKSPLLRGFLRAIALDSEKHSILYRTVIEILERGKGLDLGELRELEKVLQEHMRTEEIMLKEVEEVFKQCKDEAVKFLLQSIYRDEVFHHAVMRTLLEVSRRREEAARSPLWRAIWVWDEREALNVIEQE
ncbi:MAG: hypothetical protein DRO39_04375 [Thermoprotei archaeon]|nr:MAG: hypothetical protein DRO39_04375 [Thermoprotei archaeon]